MTELGFHAWQVVNTTKVWTNPDIVLTIGDNTIYGVIRQSIAVIPFLCEDTTAIRIKCENTVLGTKPNTLLFIFYDDSHYSTSKHAGCIVLLRFGFKIITCNAAIITTNP